MAKILINGEAYEFDGSKKPMSEALVLERELGMRYAEYEEDLQAGSMKALAGFIWTVLRRNGRDIKLADILSGDFDVDVMEVLESLQASAKEAEAAEAEATAPDPTTRGDAPPSAKGGIPTTPTSTRGRSRTT